MIKNTVGNNLENNPFDVSKIREALDSLDVLEENEKELDYEEKPLGYITRNLDTAIKRFQKNNDLYEDGLIKPGGETQRTIVAKREKKKNPYPPGVIVLNPDLPEENPIKKYGGTNINTDALVNGMIKYAQAQEEDKGPEPKPENENEKEKVKTDFNSLDFDATGRMNREEESAENKTPPAPERKPSDSHNRPTILKGVDNQKIIQDIEKEESSKEFMYKDNAKDGGKVTVGYGLMIPNVEEAKKLPCVVQNEDGSSRPATAKEIEQAFGKVDKFYNKNNNANTFKPKESNEFDGIYLPKQEAEKLLQERLRTDANRLRKEFPEFDDFSPQRQRALMDMQYNLGSTKFRRKNWPSLFDAVDQKDWERAARESNRKGISNKRNKNIRDKFMNKEEDE